MEKQVSAEEYRRGKLSADPIRAEQVDGILNGGDSWKLVYQLVCRLENAEKRASKCEMFLEQNDRLKSKLFDLMHLEKSKEILPCCGGAVGKSSATGEELRFHAPNCALKALGREDVAMLGDLLKVIQTDRLEEISDQHVDALVKAFGSNKSVLKKGFEHSKTR